MADFLDVVLIFASGAGGAVLGWFFSQKRQEEKDASEGYAAVGAENQMFSIEDPIEDLDCETLQNNLESNELELELLRASFEEKERELSQLRAAGISRQKTLERQVDLSQQRTAKLQAELEEKKIELEALRGAPGV